eukprot:3941085-Rhodomonas_salina.2
MHVHALTDTHSAGSWYHAADDDLQQALQCHTVTSCQDRECFRRAHNAQPETDKTHAELTWSGIASLCKHSVQRQ